MLNNWYPTEILGADMPYSEHSVGAPGGAGEAGVLRVHADALRCRRTRSGSTARPASGRWSRSSGSTCGRTAAPNSTNRQTALSDESAILGAAQVAWLKRRLAASTATWKIIASDMPLVARGRGRSACLKPWPTAITARRSAASWRSPSLLRSSRQRIRNVVFVTGDVHYCAAHHYDPARGGVHRFHPFWEFVAGPAHAGTFGPAKLDRTFGPEVKFIGIPAGMKQNRPAERGLSVLRHADRERPDKGADGEAAESGG